MDVTKILLGDEAIALGAIHAGISGVYGYPGTPSTEIFEAVEQFDMTGKIHHIWSSNEKVAYEQALGMSYAGKRALVSMKHVGLNVAADPFMNSAITGVQGGLVLAVADDPGMHSSQNEQDSRYFAHFAMVPALEPSNQQQAYDMALRAFDLSESLRVPVMIRIVTRLAHSRANIRVLEDGRVQKDLQPSRDRERWNLLPMNARRGWKRLVDAQESFQEESEQSPDNRLTLAAGSPRAIVATGIGIDYVRENLPPDQREYSILHIGQYPVPQKALRKIVDASEEILFVEEGYPFVEHHLTGYFNLTEKNIRGKLSGDLPRTGELDPDLVRIALGLPVRPALSTAQLGVGRPPQLCTGCPHTSTFAAIREAMQQFPKGKVFGDIGCYALGALPPHNLLESCVDMGASISMGTGAAHAGVHPAVSAIGDSTFTHSGMTALLDAVRENTPLTVVILDNSTVGMTGAQETMATKDSLIGILKGLGVSLEHIVGIEPLPKNHDENVRLLQRELAYEGLSVVVSQRECLEALKKWRAEGKK